MSRAAAALLAALVLAAASSARAAESRSASFRNLKIEGGAAAAPALGAPPPAASLPAPARESPSPRSAARAALKAATAPEKRPAAPVPPSEEGRGGAAPWGLAAAVAAAVAAAAAWALARRRGTRDDALALAAHELKSPLSAIESYIRLMEREGLQGAADGRAWLEDLARMRLTAERLRRMVGDILELSRLEEGRLAVDARPVNMAELASEAARAFRPLAEEAGIALVARASPAAGVGDPARARQIVDNLVSNALRHTARGGTVAITCSREGARARLRVEDDGRGVPPETRHRLFERFARLSPPLRGEEGTGLGLHLGRRLARAQGGDLSYEPGPGGKGSSFILDLPGAPS